MFEGLYDGGGVNTLSESFSSKECEKYKRVRVMGDRGIGKGS
jgi:hypothetical protein